MDPRLQASGLHTCGLRSVIYCFFCQVLPKFLTSVSRPALMEEGPPERGWSRAGRI